MSSRPSPNSSSSGGGEAIGEKIQRVMKNGLQSTGLCCFKLQENTRISVVEGKIAARQKKFGIDYLNLARDKKPESQLKRCVKDALADIDELQEEMDEHYDNIDDKKKEVKEKKILAPGKSESSGVSGSSNATKPTRNSNGKGGFANNKKPSSNNNKPNWNNTTAASSPKKTKPTFGATKNSPQKQNAAARTTPNKTKPKFGANKNPTKKKMLPTLPSLAAGNKKKKNDDDAEIPEEYKDADPSKWKTREYKFSGQAKYETKGKEEKMKGANLSLAKGLEKFKANPEKYTAIAYQSDMPGWQEKDQMYILMHRKGTVGWKPQNISPKGWMTVHVHEYERLIPFKNDILPMKYRDKYTDSMTFQGKKLHSGKSKPIMPGRGMGSGDLPSLKIIGDVDPSDIFQGSVGDCWLLSGISSVAEFDGAIKRLFRKTPNLHKMPMDGKDGSTATGNMYTVTLWDLSTWKEVDIVIDERLPAHNNGSGNLLAGKPSEDGELWACYLEKALSIHCGGWDKIVGGQCTHAWAMLTGCKEQYTMQRNKATGKWQCFAKCNPKTKEWAKHTNSPHDCPNTTWRVGWPQVGGGGSRDKELDDEEMFLRLYAWDQVNYIVGAGTSGTSDKKSTGGMVDNHAYSVIESVDNVAGTDIDLIKVRNPWGSGEIEDGEFDDDGPGWDKYPQIKKALNPVVADDGIFWVTKKEFFVFFETIYLSASNMTEFLED